MGEDEYRDAKVYIDMSNGEDWTVMQVVNINDFTPLTYASEGEAIQTSYQAEFTATFRAPKLKKWQKRMLFGWRSCIPTKNTRSRQIFKVLKQKHSNPYHEFIVTMEKIADAFKTMNWTEV